jgi:hypothetical protein
MIVAHEAGGPVAIGRASVGSPTSPAPLPTRDGAGDTMKAITQDRYGDFDVLDFRDIDPPVPQDNEVLVRVHAAGLHRGDWHVMTGLPYLIRIVVPTLGLRRPKVPVLGMDAP